MIGNYELQTNIMLQNLLVGGGGRHIIEERKEMVISLRDFITIKTPDIFFPLTVHMSTLPIFVPVSLRVTATHSSGIGLAAKLLDNAEKADCQLDKRQAGHATSIVIFSREG